MKRRIRNFIIVLAVFNHDRETFIFRIHRGSFRNSPRFQHSVDLKPEIKMEVGCMMFLDYKHRHMHYSNYNDNAQR